MSLELFVAISLVVFWASLPVSLAIAVKLFDDEAMSEPHQH